MTDPNDPNVYLATELALGADRARAALDSFVAFNPHLRGIKWADVLDNSINYDAQLDVTEVFEVIPVDGLYVACAALSLWWAGDRTMPADVAALARVAQSVTGDELHAWIRDGGWS
jgi:hypothetical protein